MCNSFKTQWEERSQWEYRSRELLFILHNVPNTLEHKKFRIRKKNCVFPVLLKHFRELSEYKISKEYKIQNIYKKTHRVSRIILRVLNIMAAGNPNKNVYFSSFYTTFPKFQATLQWLGVCMSVWSTLLERKLISCHGTGLILLIHTSIQANPLNQMNSE